MQPIILAHYRWLTNYMFLGLQLNLAIVDAFFSFHRLEFETDINEKLVNTVTQHLERLGFPETSRHGPGVDSAMYLGGWARNFRLDDSCWLVLCNYQYSEDVLQFVFIRDMERKHARYLHRTGWWRHSDDMITTHGGDITAAHFLDEILERVDEVIFQEISAE